MQIDIQFRGIDISQAVRDYAARRAHFTLGRMGAQIRRVSICLVDINGPKGGTDKSCTIQLALQHSASVVVEALGSDLYEVLDRSLARAGRTLARRLQRQAHPRYTPRGERHLVEA